MNPTVALLHRCSWQAEKLLKQRGAFHVLLWLAEYADGRRERFETDCTGAPDEASDAEVLTVLAAEMRTEFAADGVVRFAVAYPGTRVRFATLARVPQPERRQVIAIEAHDAGDVHLRAHREITPGPRGLMLGKISQFEAASDSRYAFLLAGEPDIPRDLCA
jgi:hypothetical protein